MLVRVDFSFSILEVTLSKVSSSKSKLSILLDDLLLDLELDLLDYESSLTEIKFGSLFLVLLLPFYLNFDGVGFKLELFKTWAEGENVGYFT